LAVSADDKLDQAMADRAEAMIEKLGSEAISIISNPDLTDTGKEKKFGKLLHRYFDMKTIGRFALGRHWRSATPEQQKDYLDLFQSSVVKIYTQRFSDYDDEVFKVMGGFPKSKRDSVVNSQIVFQSDREPINIEWRVRKRDKGYKVIDVAVEGVSMSITQRSDFDSVIKRGGGKVDSLIEHLRNQQ
jgi:phospholipid transport system substrate-binding protein